MIALTRNSAALPSPTLWMDYESVSEVRTVAHIAMSGKPIFVHRPTGPRTMTLALLYPDEAEARSVEAAHRAGGTFAISEVGRPTKDCAYVVTGVVRRTLAPETARTWIVSAEVTETTT